MYLRIWVTTKWKNIALQLQIKKPLALVGVDNWILQTSLQLAHNLSGPLVYIISTLSTFCHQEQVSLTFIVYDGHLNIITSIIHYTFLTIHYIFLETITSSASTGAISINYPSSSSSSSGGSTSVGFFDTLPYIRLEGLTADYLNVLIVVLMLFYGLSIFSSYLNLQPLIDQFTGMHFIIHSVSSSNTYIVNVMINIFNERILI